MEDVVTTGTSVEEVIKVVEETEAQIVGIGALVDRSGKRATFSYPFYPLFWEIEAQTYSPQEVSSVSEKSCSTEER